MSRETPRPTVLPSLAWRRLLVVAIMLAVGLLVVANRYGFHRDELYFLEAGQHLAFGYVDQPPLAPLWRGYRRCCSGPSRGRCAWPLR